MQRHWRTCVRAAAFDQGRHVETAGQRQRTRFRFCARRTHDRVWWGCLPVNQTDCQQDAVTELGRRDARPKPIVTGYLHIHSTHTPPRQQSTSAWHPASKTR
ncbi:hypothetical protein M3J09_007121 [Ascochyta lentis]